MSAIIIRQPDDAEYEVVKKYIHRFWLDSSDMRKEQFKILLLGRVFVAFARLKKYSGSAELCSLGVVERFRGKRLGITLINGLLAQVKGDVFLVTVEPRYFKKAGFQLTRKYPLMMRKKRERCRTHFPVGKIYRVMIHKWKGSVAV